MSANKVTIELSVEAAQELASTCNSTVRKIDWVLENRPPARRGEAERLDERAKLLTKTANIIEKALNDRAKANSNGNVVKIANGKK